MAVIGKITVFWDITLFGLVHWHCFKGILGAAGSSGVLANSVMFEKTILMVNLHICFKMSNGDNLQWDFLSILYVAIVFISKAYEF
jgi:hypothetical protein